MNHPYHFDHPFIIHDLPCWRNYRTLSIEETLEHKLGTCIEQVNLMHFFLDNLGIPNKMFCTRVYEKDNFNDLDAEEHMHCFILYYQDTKDGKVHQIEHPDGERKPLTIKNDIGICVIMPVYFHDGDVEDDMEVIEIKL